MFSHAASVSDPLRRWATALMLGGLLTLPSACTGEAQLRTGFVYEYPVSYVGRPPPKYRYYPRHYYRGHPAYLIHGRWYYSTPRGWAIFRQEPTELRRYRERRTGERQRERQQPRYLQREQRSPRRERAPTPPTEERRRRYLE